MEPARVAGGTACVLGEEQSSVFSSCLSVHFIKFPIYMIILGYLRKKLILPSAATYLHACSC